MIARPLRSRLSLLLSVLLSAGLAGCGGGDAGRTVRMDVPFEKEGTLWFLTPEDSVLGRLDVEIAETDAERRQGLMYRRSLAADRGMLFIFPGSDRRGFWMKNTYVPLDIVFVGPDSQVVSIARRTPIMSEETIAPEGPKQFVVEVNAGYARRHDVDTTTRVRWRRTAPGETGWLDRLRAAIDPILPG